MDEDENDPEEETGSNAGSPPKGMAAEKLDTISKKQEAIDLSKLDNK